MSVEQLISPIVPTLSTSDNGTKALDLMDENKFSQLPVVAQEVYVCLVQEDRILDEGLEDTELGHGELTNFKPAVINIAHPFDALRLLNQLLKT